jgi:hypothetical protein
MPWFPDFVGAVERGAPRSCRDRRLDGGQGTGGGRAAARMNQLLRQQHPITDRTAEIASPDGGRGSRHQVRLSSVVPIGRSLCSQRTTSVRACCSTGVR